MANLRLFESPHRIKRKSDGNHAPRQISKDWRTIENRTYTLTAGNLKISGNTLIWNLPAVKTCPYAGICKKYCYAIDPERLYTNVRVARKKNFEHSKLDTFVSDMITIISRIMKKRPYVNRFRIHESGDFYSTEYLQKWIEIAKAIPSMRFYGYTKSLFINNYEIPKNMTFWLSHGGTHDSKYTPKNNQAIVIMKDNIPPKGSYICPAVTDETMVCGRDCNYCMEVTHDTKKVVAFYIH